MPWMLTLEPLSMSTARCTVAARTVPPNLSELCQATRPLRPGPYATSPAQFVADVFAEHCGGQRRCRRFERVRNLSPSSVGVVGYHGGRRSHDAGADD